MNLYDKPVGDIIHQFPLKFSKQNYTTHSTQTHTLKPGELRVLINVDVVQ